MLHAMAVTFRSLWGVVLLAPLAWLPANSVAAEGCSHPREGTPLPLTPLVQPQPDTKVPAPDYRQRLSTTPLGWPVRTTWCVWVEPAEPGDRSAVGATRWLEAVTRALAEWQTLISLQMVPAPEWAHVTIWRRRPPLGVDPAGRPRASNGRAILSLHGSGGTPPARVEPRVQVLLSPDQRLEALQATALHELGHAFGIWGHSDHPDDAMAVSAGPRPILRLSPRDRATVRWLYAQPSPLRSDP